MPPPPPPVLMEELLEEVFFRLPPDEPAWLVRASAVCKPWRRILADSGFRRRYREFHGTPPVLGIFEKSGARLIPISTRFPAQPGAPDWYAMDCRHGRALFADIGETFDLIVLDPVTGHQRRVPWPSRCSVYFSAAVLCAAQGCDHHSCQGGHFFVAFVTTAKEIALGWLYSSETGAWSKRSTLVHPNVEFSGAYGAASILVGDELYFNSECIKKYHLGTLHLSMLEKPIDGNGILMTAEDGRLGFAVVVDVTNLTLWSRDAGLEGAMGWTKLRVVDLKKLLPKRYRYGTLSIAIRHSSSLLISGVVEGTQVIFVCTCVGSYMVDLRSGRSRKVSGRGRKVFPYMSFHIPAMEAASPGQGQ